MIMISDRNIRTIASAVAAEARNDPAFAKRLDDAVSRILAMKARSGLVTTARERCFLSRCGKYGYLPDFFPNRFAAARKSATRLVEDAK